MTSLLNKPHLTFSFTLEVYYSLGSKCSVMGMGCDIMSSNAFLLFIVGGSSGGLSQKSGKSFKSNFAISVKMVHQITLTLHVIAILANGYLFLAEKWYYPILLFSEENHTKVQFMYGNYENHQ